MASWGRRLKRRLLIRRLRKEMTFFGFDFSNMSNDEFEARIEEIHRQFNVAADALVVSAKQAAAAARKIAEAMAKIDLAEHFPPRDKDTISISVLPRD